MVIENTKSVTYKVTMTIVYMLSVLCHMHLFFSKIVPVCVKVADFSAPVANAFIMPSHVMGTMTVMIGVMKERTTVPVMMMMIMMMM